MVSTIKELETTTSQNYTVSVAATPVTGTRRIDREAIIFRVDGEITPKTSTRFIEFSEERLVEKYGTCFDEIFTMLVTDLVVTSNGTKVTFVGKIDKEFWEANKDKSFLLVEKFTSEFSEVNSGERLFSV